MSNAGEIMTNTCGMLKNSGTYQSTVTVVTKLI